MLFGVGYTEQVGQTCEMRSIAVPYFDLVISHSSIDLYSELLSAYIMDSNYFFFQFDLSTLTVQISVVQVNNCSLSLFPLHSLSSYLFLSFFATEGTLDDRRSGLLPKMIQGFLSDREERMR